MNKADTQPEAYNGKTWRSVNVVSFTPKNHNYPLGGAYVQWCNVRPYDSAGGWISRQNLRGIENLSNVPMSAY